MDANSNSRKGPKAVRVDEELRRALQSYVDRQAKVSVAAEMLGISVSTLSRLLSARTGWIARATHRRLMSTLGAGGRASERTESRSSEDPGSLIGRAMLLDARGDHGAAAEVLSSLSQRTLEPKLAAAYRIAAARNAQAREELERAEWLLASVLPFLRTLGGQRLALASVALELAIVRGRRSKVADALLAFDLAENTLTEEGPCGMPFLGVVRQAYLAYALRIGNRYAARRLLTISAELLRSHEGGDSLAAAMDTWLFLQLPPPAGDEPILDQRDDS